MGCGVNEEDESHRRHGFNEMWDGAHHRQYFMRSRAGCQSESQQVLTVKRTQMFRRSCADGKIETKRIYVCARAKSKSIHYFWSSLKCHSCK